MESSLIYAASDSLKYKVNWIKVSPESEWTYFGAETEANKFLVVKNIEEYFLDSLLYIAMNRKDSKQVDRANIGGAIKNILGFQKSKHVDNHCSHCRNCCCHSCTVWYMACLSSSTLRN